MSEHMRPNLERQPCTLPYLLKKIVDGLARQRPALTYEEKWRVRKLGSLADAEPGADPAQLVALDRMLGRQASLQPAHSLLVCDLPKVVRRRLNVSFRCAGANFRTGASKAHGLLEVMVVSAV
jgi:hypothetical protein